VGTNARSQGDVGRIMVVLLTDGRANISLGRSNDDPEALTVKPTQVTPHPLPSQKHDGATRPKIASLLCCRKASHQRAAASHLGDWV